MFCVAFWVQLIIMHITRFQNIKCFVLLFFVVVQIIIMHITRFRNIKCLVLLFFSPHITRFRNINVRRFTFTCENLLVCIYV